MVVGGVPMRFYRMKTVKMQEETASFAPTDSSVKHGSSDPAFASDHGFSRLQNAERGDGPAGAFLDQAQGVSTTVCALASVDFRRGSGGARINVSAAEDRAI
jgi:hypothetical protein